MRGRSGARDAIRRFRDDRSGTTAIEYALVAGLIFLALTVGLNIYGSSAGSLFDNISTRVLAVLG